MAEPMKVEPAEIEPEDVARAIAAGRKAAAGAPAAAPKQSAVKAVENPEPTPITDDFEAQWGSIVATMRRMCAYYGYTGEVPTHVLEAMIKDEGRTLAEQQKRVLQKLHIHMLSLWSKGEVPGPTTSANLEARARRAEQSAANMRKMKNIKAAESFAAKAAEIRAIKPNDASVSWW